MQYRKSLKNSGRRDCIYEFFSSSTFHYFPQKFVAFMVFLISTANLQSIETNFSFIRAFFTKSRHFQICRGTGIMKYFRDFFHLQLYIPFDWLKNSLLLWYFLKGELICNRLRPILASYGHFNISRGTGPFSGLLSTCNV